MFEHTETIKLAGREYPIRCDINVLIEIQEQFGSLNEFEMLIAGIRAAKNPDGTTAVDENKRIIFERAEPSLKAIREILPCMLKEAAEKDDLTEAFDAVKNVKFDLYETAVKIHAEFSKCFERKNVQSAKGQKETAVKK
ncbi:MAG: hypothetical protein J6D08_09835 [Lachnospiraceae bacterium]|nr:hypothetical protein [Lachnospiraceae bacterium]